MSTALQPMLVADELALLDAAVGLRGRRVLDLGCGRGAASRQIAGYGADVIGIDPDPTEIEMAIAAARATESPVRFIAGVIGDVGLADASFDLVVMLKSLHHVPVAQMDDILRVIAEKLVPGGLLFVSEPVFAGPFNEIMRLFHDEQRVRAEAVAALGRVVADGHLTLRDERIVLSAVSFSSFEDFESRMMRLPTLKREIAGTLRAEIKDCWERVTARHGMKFDRPMRLSLLCREDRVDRLTYSGA